MNLVPSLDFSKLVRVPYSDKGRSTHGWDCYGLLWYINTHCLGVYPPSYSERYLPDGDPTRDGSVALAFEQTGNWQRVTPGEEQLGDGVVFLLGGLPLHCGLVIEPGLMLHAMAGRGTVRERYDTPGWNKRIEGIYKWNS